jgi:hypothetical protein
VTTSELSAQYSRWLVQQVCREDVTVFRALRKNLGVPWIFGVDDTRRLGVYEPYTEEEVASLPLEELLLLPHQRTNQSLTPIRAVTDVEQNDLLRLVTELIRGDCEEYTWDAVTDQGRWGDLELSEGEVRDIVSYYNRIHSVMYTVLTFTVEDWQPFFVEHYGLVKDVLCRHERVVFDAPEGIREADVTRILQDYYEPKVVVSAQGLADVKAYLLLCLLLPLGLESTRNPDDGSLVWGSTGFVPEFMGFLGRVLVEYEFPVGRLSIDTVFPWGNPDVVRDVECTYSLLDYTELADTLLSPLFWMESLLDDTGLYGVMDFSLPTEVVVGILGVRDALLDEVERRSMFVTRYADREKVPFVHMIGCDTRREAVEDGWVPPKVNVFQRLLSMFRK